MKKTILLISLVALNLSLMAQDKAKGIKYYNYQRYESAIKELEPIAASDAMANYYLGLSYLGKENTEQAKATFQKHADDAANMAGLARVMFIKKTPEEAMSMLTKVSKMVKRKDKEALVYSADAITYTSGGDLNKAVAWYNEYKVEKNSPEVLIKFGDVHRKIQGGGGTAMTSYQNAEELGGDRSISNYKQGNLWYAAQNYDSALACYERAAKADPENPLPYYDLANAYYQINKYDRAKTQIEEYLKRSDNAPEDQIQYANILYLSKDYDGAISKMESLLKSGLGKSYMHRVLGYSYLEKENIADALKNMDLLFQKHPKDKIIPLDYMTYGKILAKDPARANEANTYFDKGIAADTAQDKVPLLRKLAEDYKDNNDYASAAVWYRKVTEQESATKEMVDYWWAGRCYYQVNDYTNANAMFGELAKQNPEEPSGYYWLAKVAAAQDPKYSTGVAVSAFKKYIEMAEGNAEKKDEIIAAETYIAVVSYNQKKYAEAKTYAQKVLSLDPSDETAKQILAGIPK